MKDQFSGHVNLRHLCDPGAGHAPAPELRGTSVASIGAARCAVLGSPRLVGKGSGRADSGADIAADVLAAWNTHGPDLPNHLAGGYALAIFDPASQRAFFAVDRFAIQTMCYRLDDDFLSFSDRADCVQGRGNMLDPQAVFDYLYFHVIPAPRTIFRQIFRLPSAHCLLVSRDGAILQRYWQLAFHAPARPDFEQSKRQLMGLLTDAVTAEIDGEKKVGAFLSGGTDSSTVAGMLCRVTGQSAPAYSIGFDAQGYDEMEYARITAKHFGCDHHAYYVTPDDLLTSIPAIARYHDQPFGNSSALPAYYCAKMAREDGCSKLLAGDGGDELFGGNTRYALQRFLHLYESAPKALRRAVEPLCGDDSVLRRIPGLRQATGYVRHARVPLPHRLHKLNLVMTLGPANVMAPELLERLDVSVPAAEMQANWDVCNATGIVNRMLAYDWRYTLADNDLPKVRGATSMADILVGFPLLDNALVDFSMGLPDNWKLRRYKLRWFFKEALRGFLPDTVIAKKKQGFGLPHGRWMSQNPQLRKLARDGLHGLADRHILDRGFAAELVDRRLDEHPAYYGEMVWILMMLEQWLGAYPEATL